MKRVAPVKRVAPLAALALACSLPALGAGRWLELRVTPRDAGEAARIHSLGVDARTVPEGALAVYLTEEELPRLEATGIPFTILHEDLSAFYRSRLLPPAARGPRALGTGSMGGYYTLDEAVAFLDALQAAHPDIVGAGTSLGTTHEGRPILAWKLSGNPGSDEDEPEVLLLGLMHAREPETMMALLHFADRIAEAHGTDPEATYLLAHREIWIVPVLNPDGYEWNRTTAPGGGGMWRKNRRPNPGGSSGVDLNRNFSYQWGADDVGSSPNPADQTYRGPGPFSEPEAQAVRDFTISHRPVLAMNVHASGDKLLRPWAWEDAFTAEDAIYEELSRLLYRANAFDAGNCMGMLGYLANGETDDWMHGETVAKPRVFALTPETGNAADGFWPAVERILPLARELYPSMTELAWAAGPAPRVASVAWDDTAGGDGDGYPEPGETVRLALAIRNHGLLPTWGNLRARITSPACAVIVEDGDGDYGLLGARETAAAPADPLAVRIAASALPGDIVPLGLTLADDRGPYPPLGIPLRVGEPVLLFSDDLESGTGAWTLLGWGTEAAGASRPGTALSDSPGGAYRNGDDDTATLAAPVSLAGMRRASLLFEQRFWIDNDFDAGIVEVSTDGGSGWSPLAGESTDVPSGVGVQLPGIPVYDGRIEGWTAERVDLTPYTTPGFTDILLRFRFLSDGSIREDGWHVDDVKVIGYPDSAAPLPPADPVPLRVARSGDDVVFTWPAVAPGPGHGPADTYVLYRSADIRGRAGFAPIASDQGPAASDAGVAAYPGSFAYLAVAASCAGLSSAPPP